MKKRCLHWSPRGYGRCVLPLGHYTIFNEHGVEYDHQYPASHGRSQFDSMERTGPVLDPCSACGRDNVVRWARVHHVRTGEPFWRWVCTACGAHHVIPVAS